MSMMRFPGGGATKVRDERNRESLVYILSNQYLCDYKTKITTLTESFNGLS